MKPIMTIEHAFTFLSERGIYELHKKDIKIRGRWALIRSKYFARSSETWHDEVDCYDLKSGSAVAEAWDSIPYKDSPFIPNNEEKTTTALDAMTRKYLEKYPDPLEGLCLVAISGDCADNPNNDVLPFDNKHEALVREYLRADLEWTMLSMFKAGENLVSTTENQKIFDDMQRTSHEMLEVGIFHHKYHKRTTWKLAFLDEVEEIERFHPYKIQTA